MGVRLCWPKENITSAFKKTGIWPLLGDKILKTITRHLVTHPETLISLLVHLKTPLTLKSIQHLKNAYKKEPLDDKIALLFKANKKLATQHTLDNITKKGLIEALQMEKKKR